MASTTAFVSPGAGVLDSMVSVLLQTLAIAQYNISRSAEVLPDYATDVLTYGLDTFDFVVVGSGPAGSVVASRLSENPEWNVLLLEAGDDPAPESEIPALSSSLLGTEKTYNYLIEPNERYCQAYAHDRCFIASGKGLGGTTQVNFMLYHTGTRHDYDSWCAAGSTGWCYDDVWPYFKKSTTPVQNSTYAVGFLPVSKLQVYDTTYIPLTLQAATEMNQQIVPEFEEGSHLGYGQFKCTQANGRHISSYTSYLGNDIAKRSNLKILKNAQVTRLNFDAEGKRVVSLQFTLQNQYPFNVRVGKEAIISAGAIGSPKLLMLSGIGPENILSESGVPVIHDLPVGENLQDHIMVPIFIKLDGTPRSDTEDIDNLYEYLIHKRGPLSSTGLVTVPGFIKTDTTNSSNQQPDLGIHHFVVRKGEAIGLDGLYRLFPLKKAFRAHLGKISETNDIFWALLSPKNPVSRGSIKIKSASFAHDPIIDANYLSAPEDLDVVLNGIAYMEKFVNTPSFKQKGAEIIQMPLPECDVFQYPSTEYWKCYIKYFAHAGFQPAGTVKMGSRDDPTSVVDPRLLVKGVDNLRVVDGSIIPTITVGPPDGPIVMIGEKAADMIKEDWNCL